MEALFENVCIYTREGFLECFKVIKSKKGAIFNHTAVAVIILLALSYLVEGELVSTFLYVCGAVFLLVFYFALMPRRIAKTHYENMMAISNNKEIKSVTVFYEDGFVVKNEASGGEYKYQYSKIQRVKETQNYIVLVLEKNALVMIYKNGFITGDAEDFIGYMKQKTIKN